MVNKERVEKILEWLDKKGIELENLENLINKISNFDNLAGFYVINDLNYDRVVVIDQETLQVSTFDKNNIWELSDLLRTLLLEESNKWGVEKNVLVTAGSKIEIPITEIDKIIGRYIYDYQCWEKDKDIEYSKNELVKDIKNIIKEYEESEKSE